METFIGLILIPICITALVTGIYSYNQNQRRNKIAYFEERNRMMADMHDRKEFMQINQNKFEIEAMTAPRGGLKWEQPKSDPETADMDQIGLDDELLQELYRQALESMRAYNEQIIRRETISTDAITKPIRIVKIPPYESSDL